jgi:3-dehydroquinate synthase
MRDCLADEFPVYVPATAGEELKSLDHLKTVYSFLSREGIDRGGAIVAVGGGVVGDLTGFAAATWLRSVDYFQIPTTLLAMVDSSVGGKTGVNTCEGKNLVGAFYQPKAVFVCRSFLETLPAREFSAGMAEVIKYGLLADADLFRRLRDGERLRPDESEIEDVIKRCCQIKADIVREDERETAGSGGRALLNLGHTFAHAIENVAGYGEYLHGEAVAVGLVMATELSHRLGKLTASEVVAVTSLIDFYGLPTRLRSGLSLSSLQSAMYRDKKTRDGRLHLVVMETLGRAATRDGVGPEVVRELWLGAGAVDE